jgi:hypothetical protein
MSSTQRAASSERIAPSATSGVSADHPGVNELFALLAYGEVAAFYRLTEEARMAPNLLGKINMASMAAAEMAHYEMLHDELARRGIDVVPAMTRYASALENYHRLTTPSTWLEALVKTYIGDALAADSSSPRSARRSPRASGNATGWRYGRAGCSARPSPRLSSCWPITTSSSTWSCRAPTASAS